MKMTGLTRIEGRIVEIQDGERKINNYPSTIGFNQAKSYLVNK